MNHISEQDVEQLMKSFCLEGKITEQHAKEIEWILIDYFTEANTNNKE